MFVVELSKNVLLYVERLRDFLSNIGIIIEQNMADSSQLILLLWIEKVSV